MQREITVKDTVVYLLLSLIIAFCVTITIKVYAMEEAVTEITSTTETTTVAQETTTEEETTDIPLTTVKFEDIPEYTELGTFKLTAYCICQECCGKSPEHPEYGITASGTRATPGRSVAVDTSVIPFGTKLYINGNTYIAEDTGKLVKGNVVDICFENHREAELFGYEYAKVFEVN